MTTITDREYQRLITTQRKYKNYCTVIWCNKKWSYITIGVILLRLSTHNKIVRVYCTHIETLLVYKYMWYVKRS